MILVIMTSHMPWLLVFYPSNKEDNLSLCFLLLDTLLIQEQSVLIYRFRQKFCHLLKHTKMGKTWASPFDAYILMYLYSESMQDLWVCVFRPVLSYVFVSVPYLAIKLKVPGYSTLRKNGLPQANDLAKTTRKSQISLNHPTF